VINMVLVQTVHIQSAGAAKLNAKTRGTSLVLKRPSHNSKSQQKEARTGGHIEKQASDLRGLVTSDGHVGIARMGSGVNWAIGRFWGVKRTLNTSRGRCIFEKNYCNVCVYIDETFIYLGIRSHIL